MTRPYREIRKEAREAVHAAFRVAAIYIPPTGASVPLGVRLHTAMAMFGTLPGRDSVGYAQEAVATPTAIFWLEDGVTPVRGAIISVSPEEAYRVEYTHPAEGETVKAQIAELSASERVGLAVP